MSKKRKMHDQSCHLRNVATYIWNREYWFSICVWYASAASLKYFRKNSSHSCPSPPDHHQFSALIEFRQQDCSEKTKEDEYRYIRANCISRLVSSIILIFCLDNLKYDAVYERVRSRYQTMWEGIYVKRVRKNCGHELIESHMKNKNR